MPTKFYVVWKGIIPGIYNNWDECKKQVQGFSDPLYKSFKTLAEAEIAYQSNPYSILNSNNKRLLSSTKTQRPTHAALCVDAACSGNPGILEYRGVYLHTGQQVFLSNPYPEGTNNIGEFLGIVHGLAFLLEKSLNIPIYSDSKTAISWVSNKRIKTSLANTQSTKSLFDHIDRALLFLNSKSYSQIPILKWETENWGEIPADFGRK